MDIDLIRSFATSEPLGLGVNNDSLSTSIREVIENLDQQTAEDITEVYDKYTNIPIDCPDVIKRARVYLERTYLLSRQIGHSEDHDTAFSVEGNDTIVIPINDLIDRINLFTPMSTLIATLKMAMDPRSLLCE